MHTYRRADDGRWQVGFRGDAFTPVGPAFVDECWAAAYASFLNGGRFSPGEIEFIFGIEPPVEEADDDDDDTVHPARPKSLEDYPVDRRK